MVHKANFVYMISIILLLLFSSKLVFANVFEKPKHGIIADVAEKIISRSHLHIVAKEVKERVHYSTVPIPFPMNGKKEKRGVH
ncbi:hypothetical protein D8674_012957 [Pyrus ussuriensis x Pyrus communis]|uniref:Uncharacterized protein n=1 Tax=Pyrus ussuriensis x Pyrus communis TaxID=2448454 RepID=A0A5N5GP62_9ROSA|nr:hypothetical protein D8674_012957 [Pyrus ussuriensis x Pyrus communis]